MKNKNINKQSYTAKLPKHNCIVKVAIKDETNNPQTWENAIYEDGFVSRDNGKTYAFAGHFLFHKLKRSKIK